MTTETTKPADRDAQIKAGRDSYSGRSLTESQFREAMAITEIIHAEIENSGSFIEKLGDYSHAFARNQKFDALRSEKISRDLYTARYGQSMNQTRETLLKAEEALPDIAKTRALDCAESIGALIQKAPTQPFYQAYDRAAVTLAKEFGITQTGAKQLMKDIYQQHHGRELYAEGKEIEAAYHTPVREAEIAARKAERLQTRNPARSMG